VTAGERVAGSAGTPDDYRLRPRSPQAALRAAASRFPLPALLYRPPPTSIAARFSAATTDRACLSLISMAV
jgi:hypothetical protein